MDIKYFSQTQNLLTDLLALDQSFKQKWIFEQEAKEIIECYFLHKPVTLLEFYRTNIQRLQPLLNILDKYFFFCVMPQSKSGFHIYISRFRNLVSILDNGVNDGTADLNGIIYGYDTPSVFEYCRKFKPNLIK